MIILATLEFNPQKILMIHGGHKDSQAIDIKRAKNILKDYEL
jgi:putative component of toxin-antitoxin plasmid stabilization module